MSSVPLPLHFLYFLLFLLFLTLFFLWFYLFDYAFISCLSLPIPISLTVCVCFWIFSALNSLCISLPILNFIFFLLSLSFSPLLPISSYSVFVVSNPLCCLLICLSFQHYLFISFHVSLSSIFSHPSLFPSLLLSAWCITHIFKQHPSWFTLKYRNKSWMYKGHY